MKYKNTHNYLFLVGKYFGYPDCCIEAFKERFISLFVHGRKEDSGGFSGFIPCKSCRESIDNDPSRVTELIKDRICPYPYPEQGTSGEVEKYLESVIEPEKN